MIEDEGELCREQRSLRGDERALSTPVTHALTIAITGLLMITLVSTASGFLTDQQEFAARDEVETIGNQLADDVQEVVGLSNESGSATVYVNQPDSVVGSQYHVTYEEGDDCDTTAHTSDTCLVVSVVEMDVSATVPVSIPDDVDVAVSRANPSTFQLTAENSGAGGGNGALVPMSRTMRVGVGRNVDSNRYSEVIDPTNRPPVGKFTFYPDYPESGDTVTFDAAASRDEDGTIIDYEWYVDGSMSGSGSETHSATLSPGKHNVTLLVEDDEGAESIRTRRIRVSGLEYNDDLEVDSGGISRCNGRETQFSITNQWSDPITVTHVGLDPPKNVNKIEFKSGNGELAFDVDNDGDFDGSDRYYDFDTIDFSGKPDGEILRLRDANGGYASPIDIASGQTVDVSVCKYKGGGNAGETTFGFRYWNDGATNRTVIEPKDRFISDYSVEAVGGDIVVSFDSGRQLSTLDGEIGSGPASTSLTLSDFSESSSGSSYQYEASFTRSAGTYYVEVSAAEDAAGNPANSLPKNETATILGGGTYAWQTAGDWDAAQSSVGVVHENYGDYTDDSVQLGRPPSSVDSSLVSYWHFDGGSADDAEGSNDGIIEGGPTVTDGIAGTTALRFDGSDDHVRIPDDSSLEMSDNDQVTVSMWVNKHRQGNGWRALFQKSDTSYNMQFDNGDNFELTIHDDGSWISSPDRDLDTSADRYYHVVGTFDGADVKSYVDGSLIGSNGDADEIADANGHDIGIAENLDASGRHSKVSIDDVRIYDTALNANKVKKLSNVTKGSVVTDKRTGPTISKHSDIEVSYDADIDAGETITLTVYAEPDNGPVRSDSVTLDATDSGSGSASLTGINKDADTFWVRAELNSPSSKRSPELHGVVVQEGS